MIEIKLNHIEQRIVIEIARLRYECCREAGVVNDKKGGQSNEITDRDGFGAELAFSKLCNVFPDFLIGPVSGGHDVLVNDIKVDIKQTKYPDGRLLGHLSKKKGDSDIYVLMTGTLPTFTFVGWAFCDDLLDDSNIVNLGWGRVHALDQEQLNSSLAELKNARIQLNESSSEDAKLTLLYEKYSL